MILKKTLDSSEEDGVADARNKPSAIMYFLQPKTSFALFGLMLFSKTFFFFFLLFWEIIFRDIYTATTLVLLVVHLTFGLSLKASKSLLKTFNRK